MHSVIVFIVCFLIFTASLYWSKPSWVVQKKDDKVVIKPLSLLGLSLGLSLLSVSIVDQIKEGGFRQGFKFSMASGKPSLSFFGVDLGLF